MVLFTDFNSVFRRGVVLFILVLVPAIIFGEKSEPLYKGDIFPNIKLKQNFTEEQLIYLGLQKSDSFKVEEIDAEVIIVEFLNKYCASCQSQAPVFNELYKMVNNNSDLKDKVKFIGIGSGNTSYQLSTFTEQKNILFPLVPDPQFGAYFAVAQPRTPFTIVLKNEGRGKAVVASLHSGYDDNLKKFMKEINTALKLSEQEIVKTSAGEKRKTKRRKSKLNENELTLKIKDGFLQSGISVSKLTKMKNISGQNIYEAEITVNNSAEKVYICEIYRPTVCDVCHDVHFWFSFDKNGKIMSFNSIQLTKENNVEWSEDEIEKIGDLLIGKKLSETFSYNSEVDGITTATITSTIVFDVFRKSKEIFNSLKK